VGTGETKEEIFGSTKEVKKDHALGLDMLLYLERVYAVGRRGERGECSAIGYIEKKGGRKKEERGRRAYDGTSNHLS